MADITLTCGHCAKRLTVSEFVDPAALACPACGNKLALAAPPAAAEGPAGLRFKQQAAPKVEKPSLAEDAAALAKRQQIMDQQRAELLRDVLHLAYWVGAAVFLAVIGLILRGHAASLARWAVGGN